MKWALIYSIGSSLYPLKQKLKMLIRKERSRRKGVFIKASIFLCSFQLSEMRKRWSVWICKLLLSTLFKYVTKLITGKESWIIISILVIYSKWLNMHNFKKPEYSIQWATNKKALKFKIWVKSFGRHRNKQIFNFSEFINTF